MTGVAGALTLAAALLVWPSSITLVGRRARSLGGGPALRRPRALPRRLPAVTAGVAVAVLLGGGQAGLLWGAVAAIGTARLLGTDAGARRRARERGEAVERDMPSACDLLAVCLAAGVPVGAALAAVGAAVAGPVGSDLSAVAGMLRLGAEPRVAWQSVPAPLAPLGRVLVRAGESGSAVTAALRSLAHDGRSAARARTEAAVRRAGVWVLAPLGLCFLPAFLCLGVVPLVLGIAGTVFR